MLSSPIVVRLMQNMQKINTISDIVKLDGALLTAFCTVAEELNFGRAAQRLCISQPPLSRRIHRLEELVGTPLFERTTRSVRLTPAGALMYEHARRITTDMGRMLASVREVARGEGGTLSIGITPTAAFSPLVESLHSFRRQHPKIALDLREMDSVELWEELQQGRLDVALMRPVNAHESIEMVVVHTEPMCFVTRRQDSFSRGSVSLEQVVEHPLIGYDEKASPYLARIMGAMLAGAASPAQIVQVSRVPSILTLVEAGVGTAIVPRSLERLNPHVLRFHAIEPPIGPAAQFVVARPMKGKNATALAFMAELLAQR